VRTFFLVLSVALLAGCAADIGSSEDAVREVITCGGFAGFPCPSGYQCVDDRSDSCDPESGGADCIGICQRERGPRDCDRGRGVNYVSRDANQCAAIRFLCADGNEPFFNECGCGCRPTPGEACGPVECGSGEVCCNSSCGICTAPDGFCTQQICEGTAL